MAYLPRIPSPREIETQFEWSASFNAERRQRWAEQPLMRAYTLVASVVRPSRELRALRRIRAHVRGGRLLDVGCGDGRLLVAAQQAGFDVLGVELSPEMVRKALRRLQPERVLCGRLEQFELPRASFDAVVTVSYLEHEPEPLRVLQRIRELTRPTGYVFHKVPNYASLLRKALGRRWSGYRFPEHVQYYDPASLERLVRRAGFDVVRVYANPLSDNFWIVTLRSA